MEGEIALLKATIEKKRPWFKDPQRGGYSRVYTFLRQRSFPIFGRNSTTFTMLAQNSRATWKSSPRLRKICNTWDKGNTSNRVLTTNSSPIQGTTPSRASDDALDFSYGKTRGAIYRIQATEAVTKEHRLHRLECQRIQRA
jgi:hypothetical protein